MVRLAAKYLLSVSACVVVLAGCSSSGSSPADGHAPSGQSTGPAVTTSPSAADSPGAGVTTNPSTGSSSGPGTGSTAHPHKSTAARLPKPKPTVAVKKGYAKDEKYCALSPATGSLTYDVSGSNASITLAIGGLPPSTILAILWQTNDGDGRSVGSFQTSASGTSEQSTLHMFVAPSTRGDEVLITTSSGKQVAQLNRC